ncbi:MAG: hypothetical protein AB8B69_26000 [Chitinophagales bacterium]
MKPSARYKQQLALLTHPQLLELAKKQGNEEVFMEFALHIDLEKLSTKLGVDAEYEKYERQSDIYFEQSPHKVGDLMTD